MKKMFFFPALLMLMLVVPAFAQDEEREPGWTFSGEAAVVADLVFYTKASGKSGEDDDPANEKWGKNLGGSFNMMNSSLGGASSLGVGSSFFIKGYDKGDKYGYDMQLQLKVGIFGRGEQLNADADSVTFWDFLKFGFGDWWVKGNAGIFEGYIGNTGYSGVVPAYGNFTDWSNFKLENFYVKYFDASDEKFKTQGTDRMNLWSKGSSFALGLNFLDEKLRFALGTDFGYGGNTTADYYAFNSPYASASSVNMAVIFSGKGLADLLSFDVFYGVNGRDTDTNSPASGAEYKNAFGVYAGLAIGDGFGLSVGYSGTFLMNEKQYIGSDKYSIKNPLWSAIHLHMNFSGLEKFDITFNNNLSFAGAKGKAVSSNTDKRVQGLGIGTFDDGDKENYFGWDLGLALKFQATEALGLCLQLTNQLNVLSNTPKDGKKESNTNDIFFAGINAEYTIKMVTFGAGFNVQLTTDSSKYDGKKQGSDSTVALGVPLFFKVVF